MKKLSGLEITNTVLTEALVKIATAVKDLPDESWTISKENGRFTVKIIRDGEIGIGVANKLSIAYSIAERRLLGQESLYDCLAEYPVWTGIMTEETNNE